MLNDQLTVQKNLSTDVNFFFYPKMYNEAVALQRIL